MGCVGKKLGGPRGLGGGFPPPPPPRPVTTMVHTRPKTFGVYHKLLELKHRKSNHSHHRTCISSSNNSNQHLLKLSQQNIQATRLNVTSTINQQIHLYNFHLKHLKPLQHFSIFSDHHQGVSSFLAKVITYSRFSSFL